MISQPDLLSLPFPRAGILNLAPKARELVREAPVVRVRTPVGDEAWLVTGYDQVKALFNDERLGRSHPDPPAAPRASNFFLNGGPIGNFATEKADQTRARRLLAPAFTARRMQALRPRIGRIVDELLDTVATLGSPVDLHETFSYPLPVRAICELLGVPFEDRPLFGSWADRLDDIYDAEASAAAFEMLREYLHGLIEQKRRHPGEDVISDLVAAEREWQLTTDHIVLSAVSLLFAGHGTTVAHIDYGTLFLLLHPVARRALTDDLTRVPAAVEELLRIAPLGTRLGLLRYAREEIAIGPATIRAGDAVLLMATAANRDPAAFPDPDQFDPDRFDPDRFDPDRAGPRHLAFGHGPRHCVGASLARVQLQEAFTGLLRRFPTLRLAEPLENLELSTTQLVEKLLRLPVSW